MQMLRLRLPTLLPLLGLCLGSAAQAEVASWHGPWQGLDLYVQVVTRGHAPDKSSKAWPSWGNTRTDAYLFGFGSPGVDLIADFKMRGTVPSASLYVVPKAQRDQVTASTNGYLLPGQGQPDLTLQPLKGDWQSAGVPNFDLQGTVLSKGTGPNPVLSKLRVGSSLNGRRVPGQPAWATTLGLGNIDPANPGPQFGAAVQEDPSVPYALAQPLIPGFAYLSAGSEDQFYGPNRPVFYETGRRELQTRFVGFQTAGIYAVNSYSRPPGLSFEAPFAWYRFDPAAERFPNMMVRVEQFPPAYKAAPVPGMQRTAARLSWTAQDFRKWRYSLSVVGDHPLNERVKIGDARALSVPYRKLPSWAVSGAWQGASFVEATGGFSGSEGIYSYSVEANPELFKWIGGVTTSPPDTFESPYLGGLSVVSPNLLPAGFRGEYSLVYNRTPGLYLSGIDRRVHLNHAQAGVWNVGSGRLLRSADLSGDGHTDIWQLERLLPTSARESSSGKPAQASPASEPLPTRATPGVVEQSLYALSGTLIVSDAAGVSFVQGTLPADQAVPIATDAARWRTFLAKVPLDTGRDPLRLRSWLAAVPGQIASVPGARVSQLRPTAGGFRFLLTVPAQPGALKSGTASPVRGLGLGQALTEAAQGRPVLSYDRASKSWTAEAATVPVLSGQARALAPLKAFSPGTLSITVRNTGSLDQTGPAALFVDTDSIHDWPALLVPAHGSVTQQVAWAPERSAHPKLSLRWTATPLSTDKDTPVKTNLATADLGTLQVGELERVGGQGALDLSSPFGTHFPLDLALVCLCAFGGLWLIWRRTL
jgi:hypothetical protein